jgi:KIP1-like protein
MLRLIEEDADSFAQRAEMYYKKRPLLVEMIGDFYRNHRSLAEQCDQLRSSSNVPRIKLFGVPTLSSLSSCSYVSSTCSSESDSEVDDPEPDSILDTESEQDGSSEMELKRFREENKALKVELEAKDEEKREVIRQLSYAIDLLETENRSLRKKHVKESAKREGTRGGFDVMRWTKEIVSGKIFMAHCRSQTTVVAL